MVGKKTAVEEISVVKITEGRVNFLILGKTPLVFNRMSAKVQQGLLLPRKKTAADKAASLKHNPPDEYRSSVHQDLNPDAPTVLMIPAVTFKGAMRSAAIDIPGAAKSQIGRLTYVNGEYIRVYGVPRLYMAVVRAADINRTPDIRTRAILPRWCAEVSVTYTTPLLNEQTVANLLAAAGVIRGVGDGRPEKGWGSFGQFSLVSDDDADFLSIKANEGREAQREALENPVPYDQDSAELLSWWHEETTRRGFKVA